MMTHAGRDQLIHRANGGDTEARAALMILDFLDDNRAWRHVDDDGIGWEQILNNGTWSSGERKLLELGQVLWTGHGQVDLVYLFTCMSGTFEQAVVDAITARRGGRPLPVPFGTAVSS